jgi:hypothetical protein
MSKGSGEPIAINGGAPTPGIIAVNIVGHDHKSGSAIPAQSGRVVPGRIYTKRGCGWLVVKQTGGEHNPFLVFLVS